MKQCSRSALFPSLAVELVELIAGVLENSSLLHLRLTCRQLQKKTFHHFAWRFFSSVKTDLSENSLAHIHALSQHSELRQYVQSLAFMLQSELGHGLVWDRQPWGTLSDPMNVEQIRRLRDDLVNSLTRCRSFFIFCRYPEGRPDMKHMTITDAVAVFFSLVIDGQLPVSSFHLIYANQYSRTLIMDMRRMPKMLYRQPQFKLAWSALKKLSLEQYLTLDNVGFLLELVLSAPNLQTLLLNLGSHDLAGEFMHELAETGSFSQLQELALFRTSVRAPDLIKILASMRKTLATLTLYHVSLSADEDWTSVLTEVSTNCDALQSISLYYLWATTPAKELYSFPDLQKETSLCQSPGHKLHMLHAENPVKSPSILGIDYTGPRVSRVLSLLQTTAVHPAHER